MLVKGKLLQKKETVSEAIHMRNYGFDNLRLVLIFCVIFGHLLEICPFFESRYFLYCVIYSFHMPVLIFLFGYFAKFDPKRIIVKFIIPYLLFQTIYITYSNNVLNTTLPLQYTTPYWLLWYLLVCIFYQIMIPFFDTDKKKMQVLHLILTIILALLVGYDNTIGYTVSLSRFFVFLPWFILGYYYRKREAAVHAFCNKYKVYLILACVGIVVFSMGYLRNLKVSAAVFYGSYAYEVLEYTAVMRLGFMLIALAWIGLLVMIFRKYLNKKISFLTTLGANTFSIFLFHGFVVKTLPCYTQIWNIPGAILWITCVTIIVFGNSIVGKGFKWVFSDHGLMKWCDK